MVKNMQLTDIHSKKINKIKRKHDIDEQFDLLGRLNYLPKLMTLYPNHPRNSEIAKHIRALKKSAIQLIVLLDDVPKQIKDMINELLTIPNTKDPSSPIEMNPDWQLSKFEEYLQIFWVVCTLRLQRIPLDKGGRKQSSIPKFIILILAKIYKDGTGKSPTCGWSDCGDDITPGTHIGDFYEFVLDVRPFLEIINIDLGTNITIGGYCTQVLKEYRSTL